MVRLGVWLNQQLTGWLTQNESGRMSFSYLPDANCALSLSMPCQNKPFEHEACEAYFGGLLPESEQARQLIGKRFGVNGNNSFSLLRSIGHECAGAVSLHEETETPAMLQAAPVEGRILSEKELCKHILELPRRPLLAGLDGIRLSLSGAADKAAVCLINSQVALPQHDSLTTHILKPDIGAVGATAANEFFCMRLAHLLGLAAPAVDLRQADDQVFLLVERYDRRLNDDGSLHRLHQEDFCQALGVVSARKYQSEGGPGFKQCFDLLRRVSRPAIDRNRLAKVIMFNFLIGNMDAHGKNFSVLHEPALTLAPVYDILCTRVYEELSTKLAMKVDKYYQADEIFPRHWQRLCQDCGFAYPPFRDQFIELCDTLPSLAEAERDRLKGQMGQSTFNQVLAYVQKNTARALSRFEREPATPQRHA